jgi:hypothetical protein
VRRWQGFQDLIQKVIMERHDQDPVLFPWKSLSEIPDDHLFNMDEIASNGKTNREKKIYSDVMLRKEWMRIARPSNPEYIKRLFEVTSGDNGDKLGHRTIVLTTRGDGKFATKSTDVHGKVVQTTGACAPIIINQFGRKTSKTTRGPTEVVSAKGGFWHVDYDDGDEEEADEVNQVLFKQTRIK